MSLGVSVCQDHWRKVRDRIRSFIGSSLGLSSESLGPGEF